MSESASPGTATYEIRLKGHISPRSARMFEGFQLTEGFEDGAPVSILTGAVADQSALHGILERIRDLGMEIVSVNQIRAGSQRKRGYRKSDGADNVRPNGG